MEKILVGTKNKGKIRELKEMLNFNVISQDEYGIKLDVEENGKTFEENAIIKVKAIKEEVKENNIYIIAEDSGIEIEALSGYPGVKTKRAAIEELKREVTDEERNNLILKKMNGIKNRKIVWKTSIALIDKDGSLHTFNGEVIGKVSDKAIGKNGFGFDPIFYIEEEKKTLAQMTNEEKEKYSARKRAIIKLNNFLKNK